jgi:adenosylcobinamide-GDP ribazoletransferase
MRSALGFLTVLGGHAAPDDRAPAWFAVVGGVVGLGVGGVWWAAGEVWPPVVAAVLAVSADAALTGMLHLDGLADSADGLLPPLPRERRLVVMSAPDVGAFGVVVLVLVLAARVSALAALAPDPLLVAGLWAGARATMAITLATVPYARLTGGLASSFGAPASADVRSARVVPVAAVAGLVVALAVVVGAAGWSGVLAGAGLVLGAGAVVALARRRLGGFTGDVLGAAGVVGETIALLAAAARW